MAGDVVIRVEGLGKKYIIGHETERERYAALRDVAARIARNVWKRTVDAARGRAIVRGEATEEFWALKDVNFEVGRSEVLGIIGRNGAGKSTLLKILSRITEPTEGRVSIAGRVASLLEIGTGFHPELTGRENIYLNGAILGMSRAEIRRKLDEIVDFSGVEKFIDTPVKRYSSGMHVRLAFSVAAHLEPEILIVDEVLAVGDAEFQKKCLGKMGEVAESRGRTVLFVSHNMAAVQALCGKCILLRDGQLASIGAAADVIDLYLSSNVGKSTTQRDLSLIGRKGEGNVRFKSVAFVDQRGRTIASPKTGEDLKIRLDFLGSCAEPRSARIGITFYDNVDTPLFLCANEASCGEPLPIAPGDGVECRIPRLPLSAGRYKIGLFLELNGVIEDWLQESLVFEVLESSYFGTTRNVPFGWEGRTVLVNNVWHKIGAEHELVAHRAE
jgi:lipopolysaccharide transport system ATP-binding protein